MKTSERRVHICLFTLLLLIPVLCLICTNILTRFDQKITADLETNLKLYLNPPLKEYSYPKKAIFTMISRYPINIPQIFEPKYVEGAEKYVLFAERYHNIPFFVTMNNIIASSENVLFDNTTLYLADPSCNPKYWNWEKQNVKSLTIRYKVYENVISLGHQHSENFGHWQLEILPALYSIPKSIRNKSYFIIKKTPFYIEEGLRFIDFNLSHVITGDDTYVLAKNLYTVSAFQCGILNQWLLLNFRKGIVEKLNLDTTEPTKYVLFNRKNGTSRYLANFDEILEAVRKKYPSKKFEVGVYHNTFNESAKYFNDVKLIFSVHASLLSNAIYMQPATFVVELQMETILTAFFFLSVLTGKRMICVRDKSISYRDIKPNVANVTAILDAFSLCFN